MALHLRAAELVQRGALLLGFDAFGRSRHHVPVRGIRRTEAAPFGELFDISLPLLALLLREHRQKER
jgi:hypothetical protein